MDIKQLKLSRMATFCYLVGDGDVCALIDPAFDTKRILAAVDQAGYKVVYIINTHGHFDHTAGNASIRAATGARILIHELDAKGVGKGMNMVLSRLFGGKGSPRPDTLLKDGDLIEIGETALRVLHTPGHSKGSICLHTEGHVFTGDTLFVGGVGRTDLPGGSSETLIKSLQEKIFTLPGDTVVWPGHDYGSAPRSTVGHEMKTNRFTRQAGI